MELKRGYAAINEEESIDFNRTNMELKPRIFDNDVKYFLLQD